MRKTILILSFLVFGVAAANAQTAPVPSQLQTAKTAFLSAGGAPVLGNKANLVNNLDYQVMYKALTDDRRYRLVATPAEADLSMEVSIFYVPGQFSSASLRLTIRDAKSQALLWIIDEPVDGAYRQKTFEKNLDKACEKVIIDLKALGNSIPPQPAPNTPATTSIQQSK